MSALALPSAAGARREHFPAPSCRWESAQRLSSVIDDPVRAKAAVWHEHIAPTLSCLYVERRVRDQPHGRPIVGIEFLENQRFSTKGLVPVAHLGSCVEGSSCPEPHEPAWMDVRDTPASATRRGYESLVELQVEDGLNAIFVAIVNQDGPLPVANETATAESIVRRLLPRFRWH